MQSNLKFMSKPKIKTSKMKLLRFGRDFKPDQNVILRDYLAIERTRLANERTLLTYIKSSLYLLLSSVALYQLKEYPNFQYLAITALIFSVIFFVIGIYRFTLLKRSLKKLYNSANHKSSD